DAKRPLPSGTVTFAFTDIEGSTARWERDRAAMEAAVARHDVLLQKAIRAHGGYAFKTLGDAVCAAFSRPSEAAAAMLEAQRALAAEDFSALGGLRVRVAIHTGVAQERDGDYFGPVVNRVARLLTIGHGGQILVSEAAAAIVRADLHSETLRDLGEHRLKDLTRPERVYELSAPDLDSRFPPLRSLDERANDLPIQLTSFVGREAEVDEIAALLRRNRLVTLVGAGGVGKTRTALQVAANFLDEARDGVWFVELAPLASGEYVASTVAHELGIPSSAADPLAELTYALKAKTALLVFDNCEHLIASAAHVISTLLGACPNVRVLASSRQSLDVAGEQAYRLPSLEETTAVALFVERARSVDDRFALTDENASEIAEICRRLDGIPLAIELAASRTDVLGLRRLSEKLDERFRLLVQKRNDKLPRQQTLRALIDWSFDLLDDDERAVLAQLAIFAGGWTLPAAEAVCAGGDVDDWQVLDLFSALVSKSLVVTDADCEERRYGMLNSIREYSRERLEATAEAGVIAGKHARYYAGLVSAAVPLAEALEDARWRAALAPELDNLRAAVDWAIVRNGDADAGLQLLSNIEWPELLTTPLEAIRWFDAAAEALSACADDLLRARVLRRLVRLEWLVGRSNAHRERTAQTALAAARASTDSDEIAQALANLATVHRDAGRFDAAEPLFSQAYERAPALSAIALNAVLRNWAVANLQRGDVKIARQRFAEVAQRERPGSEAHASALLNLGELEFAEGNVEVARTFARQARDALARLNTAPLGLAVCNLAAYAMAVDDLHEARELLREALALLERSGSRWMTTALEHHAVLAGLGGDHERAAILLGFTSARYAGNDTRQTTERHGYDRLTRMLEEIYDETELERWLSVGARLGDEQALEHAAAISQATVPSPDDAAAFVSEGRRDHG
ncbi:MAG TPA: adenylate/guanylate cyclase domain-containing protein, partial [Candidatus Tumulicola sp.]